MKILLIDGTALCHTVHYALPSLQYKGIHTAIIYGFLTQLLFFQRTYEADRIVFAWDSKTSKRKEIFPLYKKKRREKSIAEYEKLTDEEKKIQVLIKKQFTDIHADILPSLGFVNNFSQEGMEGDDIVASVCNSYKNDDIIIISSDADLFQLITKNHVMYHLKHREIINVNKVYSLYQISPERFGEMKSLSGCTSDEVPGIPGVGDERAALYMTGGLKPTSKIYQKIQSSQDIIEFTKRLVVLPFEGTQEFLVEKDTCTINKFKRLIRNLGFISMREPGYILDLGKAFCNGKTSIHQQCGVKRFF